VDVVLSVLLGLLYGNFVEWFAHKYVLHGLGRKKTSRWSFHFHEHHKLVRQHKGRDPQYLSVKLIDSEEFRALSLLTIAHLPLLLLFPVLTATLAGHAVLYYTLHRKSHLDPTWAKKYIPWHYDHHMYYQNHNWCVTFPLFDHIFGTRKKPGKI
jgi:sterol desaturase/sphingolipid hydroxylase (fatty acid hydroxylase superfamily)